MAKLERRAVVRRRFPVERRGPLSRQLPDGVRHAIIAVLAIICGSIADALVGHGTLSLNAMYKLVCG